MNRVAFLSVLLILTPCLTPSTSCGDAEASGPPSTWRHAAVAHVTSNGDDGGVGGTYRFYFARVQRIALFASFSGRFWEKNIIEPLGHDVFLQLKEQRYLWAGGVHKTIVFARYMGAFVDGGAGYTAADFAGTARSPDEGWTPIARVGLLVHTPDGNLLWEIAYRYADLRTAPENWFYLGVGGTF